MDIPRAAACVPGLQEIAPDGENRYCATLQSRVGPMRFTFTGTVLVLESDESKGEARFEVEASDRRVGGSVKAEMSMRLIDKASGQTELSIVTETAFLGKLGELGQPLMHRKARSTMEGFARNLAEMLEQSIG